MGAPGTTPGPFEIRCATKPDNTGGYDYAVIAPGKAIIAECFECVDYNDDGVTYDKRPAEANARQFAASGDLYDQLTFAVKLLDNLPGFRGTAQLDRMHAALAKARGE
jgi:hypothetical protein